MIFKKFNGWAVFAFTRKLYQTTIFFQTGGFIVIRPGKTGTGEHYNKYKRYPSDQTSHKSMLFNRYLQNR